MALPLMKSVSGIRGIVGESLTPELIQNIAAAFAQYVKRGRVVIGRDSRPTGAAISAETASVLVQCGCEVINLDLVPTPTVGVAVEELKAAGGIVISASHNPIEWNAFKLMNASGTFLGEQELADFFELMEKPSIYSRWNEFGSVFNDNTVASKHIEKVLSVIDVDAIKQSNFKVVLDSVNGAGSFITKELLEKLGCTVIPLYCTPDGTFPRGAEPVPENLTDLCDAVKKHKANIGFAQDPDADRLAIVDETGRAIGEEYTIALAVEYFMSRKPGTVVVNMSTTKAVEDIAELNGGRTVRAKVGEINVVDMMRSKGAVIGGEGNGGVISPEIHLGRDSLAGMAYILYLMALRKKKLSEIFDGLPHYVMRKGKIVVADINAIPLFIRAVAKNFKNERLNTTDGLRIDFVENSEFAGGWVHMRPSNTEPVFRIIAEGRGEEQADAIYNFFDSLLDVSMSGQNDMIH